MQEFVDVACPYCGQWIGIVVDRSVDHQRYIEDCQVCCRPIVVGVTVGGDGQVQVDARRDDEA